jgi:hypothetical protein
MKRFGQAVPFLALVLANWCALAALAAVAAAEVEPPRVFSTWDGFEVDKCASIWLIKRFVDRDATIKIVPKGEPIGEGTPFDAPEAKLRRYHNLSTFESILRAYRLVDDKLVYLGRIVHDLEINVWERKSTLEAAEVQRAVAGIIAGARGADELIEGCLDYFDALYPALNP